MIRIQQWKRGRKRLTDEEVDEVRVAEGKQADVAIRFGISAAQVNRIKKGKRRVKK